MFFTLNIVSDITSKVYLKGPVNLTDNA